MTQSGSQSKSKAGGELRPDLRSMSLAAAASTTGGRAASEHSVSESQYSDFLQDPLEMVIWKCLHRTLFSTLTSVDHESPFKRQRIRSCWLPSSPQSCLCIPFLSPTTPRHWSSPAFSLSPFHCSFLSSFAFWHLALVSSQNATGDLDQISVQCTSFFTGCIPNQPNKVLYPNTHCSDSISHSQINVASITLIPSRQGGSVTKQQPLQPWHL